MPGQTYTRYSAWRAVRRRTKRFIPCLSPCDRCKNPEGVMVGLAENIQACLRIFRRAQHQWLARDILHQAQGVFDVFVLWLTPTTELIRSIRLIRGRKGTHPLAYCPPGSICGMISIPRALPPVTHGSALQAPECLRDIGDCPPGT